MAGKKSADNQGNWAGEVEKYSRQIWLAGLGAYSKISKDGARLFDDLVADGEQAEEQVKSGVDQLGSLKLGKSAKSKVDGVRGLALGKWNELEEAFDKRLNNAVSRLGVPSRLEVKALNDKIDRLTAQVEGLTGMSATSVASQGRTRTEPKPAIKPAAKAVTQAVSKTASKAAEAAKPVAKAAKPAVKAAVKPAVKAASKAVPKPGTKPAAKPAASKPEPKPSTPARAPAPPSGEAAGDPVATPSA